MNIKKHTILALSALAGMTITANAASIAVNMGPNTTASNAARLPANNVLPPATVAGVVPQANWNDKTQNNHGTSTVVDDSGTLLATTVSIQTSWTNGVQNHGSSDGNQILMNGGIDNGGGVHGATVQNIPYALYDVYIYFDGGSTAGRGGPYQVWDTDNGNAVLATQNGFDTGTFSGTFIEASTVGVGGTGIDANGNPVGSNYIHFTGLTAPNIRIISDAANNALVGVPTDRAPINGFQIVEPVVVAIPEPSTFMLTALGFMGFLVRRKR